MKKVSVFAGLACILLLAACDKGVDSPRGFSLPEGDQAIGKQVFIKHNCISCHSVSDIDDSDVQREREPAITLGSNSAIVTTYAELVTSIINPSHRISRGAQWGTSDKSGESVMHNYNEVLTVDELINLVAYLQPHYKVTPFPYTPYGTYEILQK